MNVRQLHALELRDTDTVGALKRMCGSVEIFEKCLLAFLDDPTVEQLNVSIECGSWDEAFTAAHALKGLAGNLGFVPLMHNTGQLIVLIRGGRLNDLSPSLELVNSSYRDIVDGIHQYFAYADESRKGSNL